MANEHVGLGWRRHRVETVGARLDAVLGEAIEAGRRPVSKLAAVAERIAATKTLLDGEADKLMARLDEIEKAAPGAFARGHAFLDAQKADVAGIESTLRQLSNLPLGGSDGSQGG